MPAHKLAVQCFVAVDLILEKAKVKPSKRTFCDATLAVERLAPTSRTTGQMHNVADVANDRRCTCLLNFLI